MASAGSVDLDTTLFAHDHANARRRGVDQKADVRFLRAGDLLLDAHAFDALAFDRCPEHLRHALAHFGGGGGFPDDSRFTAAACCDLAFDHPWSRREARFVDCGVAFDQYSVGNANAVLRQQRLGVVLE